MDALLLHLRLFSFDGMQTDES